METGKDDLSSISYLTLTIDTWKQSVYDLHLFLPNLQHLVLDGSIISSVRDLGIGLRFLQSLSLSGCGLIDIDGIGVLTGLKDLCLSDNTISDVTPLAMHENIQVSLIDNFFSFIHTDFLNSNLIFVDTHRI